MISLSSPRQVFERRSGGFTLLELVVAFTILAAFLLPMMLIISKAKVRAIKYTMDRQVRDLAQRRLFEVIHDPEVPMEGDFAAEGHPFWEWRVELDPNPVVPGEPTLLAYNIYVYTPQKLNDTGGAGSTEAGFERDPMEEPSFTMTVWALPDQEWYLEQEELYNSGQPSVLYGDPQVTY